MEWQCYVVWDGMRECQLGKTQRRKFFQLKQKNFNLEVTYRIVATKEPPLRPKGMGLGANKMANVKKQEKKIDNASELILKKGAFAKITAGSHKGLYCQVKMIINLRVSFFTIFLGGRLR